MKKRFINTVQRMTSLSRDWMKKAVRVLTRRPGKTPVDTMINQFFDQFTVHLAVTPGQRKVCYETRHQVYCDEFGFEPVNPSGLETDEYDDYALSCYIVHKASQACAGTIRLVLPTETTDTLPLEKHCLHAITDESKKSSLYPRCDVAEVSRLAVPKRFRKAFRPSYIMSKDSELQSTGSASSLLSVALYLMAASICLERQIKLGYIVVEPRLARSMAFIGIRFHQIGEHVDYHGRRAPYALSPTQMMTDISPSLREFQQRLCEQMDLSQIHNDNTGQIDRNAA